MAEEREAPRCAHCGAELSIRGTAGADGKRYCSSNRDCIRARDRNRRAAKLGPLSAEDMETRPCSNCGRQLPARPKRATDSPLGRWCRDSTACRKAREHAPEKLQHDQMVYDRCKEIHEEYWAAEVVDCDGCGQAGKRVGFSHEAEGTMTGVCKALGQQRLPQLFEVPYGCVPCGCPGCVRYRQALRELAAANLTKDAEPAPASDA